MGGKAAAPGKWQNVLRADSNKTELFSFLSKVLLQAFCQEDKEVVLIDGKGCSAHSYCRMSTPWPHAAMKKLIVVCYCTYHTLHSMATTRCSFALLTPMLVLAVFSINHLPAGCELCLAYGTGKSFRYLAAHQIAANLRPEMSCALPMFHALTGCDNVSRFAEHGKKTAWSTWKSLPELTDALLMLADGPKEIPDGAINIIERFVILLFDRTSTCTKVAHARRKLFPRKEKTWCSKSRLHKLL